MRVSIRCRAATTGARASQARIARRRRPGGDRRIIRPMSGDPHDLARFVAAQDGVYEHALAEIRSGGKRSHWMWFIFPQFAGLGASATSAHFAIRSVAEARAYMDHPILGPRLSACAEAALSVHDRTAREIFG